MITTLPVLSATDVAEIRANACRIFRGKRLIGAIKPGYAKCFHGLPDRYCAVCLENSNRTEIRPRYLSMESRDCDCDACQRPTENADRQAESAFVEQMRACGFEDADGAVPTTNLIDDVLFIWSRVSALGVRESQAISKLTRDAEPIQDQPLKHRRSTTVVLRPLQGIEITKPPKHWDLLYWQKANKDVPSGALFHEQLLDEIEQVEFNHDLPSGGTRTYSFGEKVAPPLLKLHWTDSRFESKPFLIDDPTATFEEQILPPAPEEWLPPKIQVEVKRGKNVITNVRCRLCGAVNKQKYPKGGSQTRVCKVDSDYLCNREACVRARSVEKRLAQRTGYTKKDDIKVRLINWVYRNEHNESDPNLKCDKRYDLDTRGRKGLKRRVKDHEDYDVAQPAKIHTAEDVARRRNIEEIFLVLARCLKPSTPAIKIVEYDKAIHRLIDGSFEERRHTPILNALPNHPTARPKNYESILSLPYVAFVVDPAYILPERRDPEISKLDELNAEKDLKAAFKAEGWTWYGSNIGRQIFTTLKQTTGAADEIRQQQLAKLKELKARGRSSEFIEDIYLRKKSMKQVAKEQKRTKAAVKQKAYRDLNKPVVSEDQQWLRAAKGCKQDGVYAVATIHGKPRAYLLLAADKFKSSYDENYKAIEDSLHNIICDILLRRAKKGRIEKEQDLRSAYSEIYDEFQRLGWRMLRDGSWYDESQELVASSTL